MAILYTADLHLGHAAMLRYEPTSRPFATVEEMDAAIVDGWNRTVGPDDTVWVLGDVSLRAQVALDLVPLLNGRKILVAGNHDACWVPSTCDPQSTRGRRALAMADRYREVFHEVHPSGIVAGHSVDGIAVVLSHLPTVGDSRTGLQRYPEARPPAGMVPIVCGHVHGRWRTTTDPVQVNVGVDVRGLRPVLESELAADLRTLDRRTDVDVAESAVASAALAGIETPPEAMNDDRRRSEEQML